MMTVPQALAVALQHHQAGRLAEAEALYRQILAGQPRHADALHLLGMIAHQRGQNEQAVEWVRRALACEPGHALAWSNLGEVYRAMGLYNEAAAALLQALALEPDAVAPRNNLGILHAGAGRLPEAIAEYRRALQVQPDFVDALHNLGVALHHSGELEEALPILHRALALQPRHAEILNSVGNALMESGKLDEALDHLHRSLELEPQRPISTFNCGLIHLLRGDFERGWPLYEARQALFDPVNYTLTQPRWEGGEIRGQRLLIIAEQGLGDSIQFIRYARLLATRGAQVLVRCQASLAPLFRELPEISALVPDDGLLPAHDLFVLMLSLPLAFQTRRETIPHEVPYLFADPARQAAWQERLGARSRLRVGLAWAGNPDHRRARIRDVHSEKMRPLLGVESIDFFSLQIGAPASGLIDHTAHLHDFAETAALIEQLDLVITVDTAVAHLAGALGKPVWTLLPFHPDWRWGLERDDSLWYPTMRLFRQPARGDWDSVIARVAAELRRHSSPP